jgi:hypothetical protein
MIMEDQIPSSIPPQQFPGQITPETLEQMKQQARELAVAQYFAQQQQPQKNKYIKFQNQLRNKLLLLLNSLKLFTLGVI